MPMSEQRATRWLHTHAHHWHTERRVSRRAVLRTVAGAAGVLGAAQVFPPMAFAKAASKGRPRPINGLAPMFEVQAPQYKGEGRPAVFEQAVLTDFDGLVGSTDVTGFGIGSDGAGEREMYFRCDMRFMRGRYLDTGGTLRHSTFAFI
jgi:hypothetical protein